MIIYDPKITGSFDVNGTSISSLDQIDVTSGSVSSLNDATSSYALIAEISGSTTSLSSSLASELLKNTTDTLTGDLTVTGTLTAQDLHVQEVTSSIVFSSGSNKFGETLSNTHEFTGSLNLTGSLKYTTPTLRIVGTSTDGSDDQAFFFAAGGDTSDSRGAYIWGRGNEATNGGRIQINAGNTATGDIQLYTGGSVRTYISSSGFIGIGTQTELQSKLTLYGSDKEGFITFREISNRSWQIFAKDGDFNIRDDNADSTYFFIDGGTGNTGIGTTSPLQKLHINGNLLFENNKEIRFKDSGGTQRTAVYLDSSNDLNIGTSAGKNLKFINGGSYTERMRLDVQGNLQLAKTAFSGSGDPRLFVGSKGNYYYGSGTGLGDFHIGDGNYGLSFGAAIGGAGAGDIRIWTTGGTHNLRIGTNSGDHLTLNSSGNLGVGTSSPVAKLHVRHTSTFPGLIVEADAGNEQIVVKRSSNTNEQLILGFHSSDYGRIQAVEQGVGYRPLALNQDGGNVGIGTTSPSGLLTVNTGASGTYDAIVLSRDTYGEAGVIKQAAGGLEVHSQKNLVLGADEDNTFTGTSSNIIFKVDGSESGRFNSGGNLGIGSTSPATTLDVAGVTTSLGLHIPQLRTLPNTTGAIQIDMPNTSYNAIRFYSGSQAHVIHGFTPNWSGGVSVGHLNMQGISGVSFGSWTAPDMHIHHASGNVGIGVSDSTPAAKLEIVTAGNSAGGSIMLSGNKTDDTAKYGSLSFAQYDSGNEPEGFAGLIGYASFTQNNLNIGGGIWEQNAATQIDFYTYTSTVKPYGTSGNLAMRIDSNANIGIGTTAPSEKLHILGGKVKLHHQANGYGWIYGEDTNHSIIIRGTRTGTVGNYTNYHQYGSDYSSGGGHHFWTGGALASQSKRFSIANDYSVFQNTSVGINTTSPNAPLHVNGGVHFGPDSGVLNPSTGQVLIETASGGTPTLQFYPYGSSVMFLKSDGTTGVLGWSSGADREVNINNEGAGKISVGIGTGAPAGQFHSYISATRYFGHNVNSGDLSVLSDNNSAPVFKVQGTGTADLVNILDNTSQVFTIKDGGNVGIGTTSPSADLHINDGEGAAIVYQGSKRGKMIGKTIQRHTAGSPKTDLFTINSFQSANSNLYAVVTVLYVSPTSTNGGKMSAQFWIDNDNQSSPTIGSFTHEQQVGSATFSLEWDNTNKILKFVPASANYWYYVVDVEYVAFDGASVTFNTSHSYSEE